MVAMFVCTDIPPYLWGCTPETTGIGNIIEVTYIHNV